MESGRTKRSDGQLKDVDAVVYSEVQMLVKLLDSIPQGFRITKNLPTTPANSKLRGYLSWNLMSRNVPRLDVAFEHGTPLNAEIRMQCCITEFNST